MDKILIIDRYLRCRFLLKVGPLRLEPDLFCKMEKSLTVPGPDGESESCTNLIASPYPLEDVATKLTEYMLKGKLPVEASQLTLDEIALIQTFIANHYNFSGKCFNCHY